MKRSLLVLIVRDAGLRSMLSARLSLSGVDVLSAQRFDDPALERRRLQDAVLVLDSAIVNDAPAGWLGRLRDESRWRRVVVLTASEPDRTRSDERLIFLDRENALDELLRLADEPRD